MGLWFLQPHILLLLSAGCALYGYFSRKNGFVQLAVVILILPLMDLLSMFIPAAPPMIRWVMSLALFMAVMHFIRSKVD